MGLIQLGSITANIGGDDRYTESVETLWDPLLCCVTITVRDCRPIGGMDGPGGSTQMEPRWTKTTGPSPTAREVAMLLREAINKVATIVKEYGRPSKNFRWRGGLRGISMATIQTVLDIA